MSISMVTCNMQISLLGNSISTMALPSSTPFPSSADFRVVTFANSLDPEQAKMFDSLMVLWKDFLKNITSLKRNNLQALVTKKYAKLLGIWVLPAKTDHETLVLKWNNYSI